MHPLRCDGATLMEYVDGKWVECSSQPQEKSPEACERLRASLYSAFEDRRHGKQRKEK